MLCPSSNRRFVPTSEVAFHHALTGKSWSLDEREAVQRAKDAALDECGETGKSCRIIVCVPMGRPPRPCSLETSINAKRYSISR